MSSTRSLWNRIGFNPKVAPYIFISPFFILFLIFGLYPLFYSAYIPFSTCDWPAIADLSDSITLRDCLRSTSFLRELW